MQIQSTILGIAALPGVMALTAVITRTDPPACASTNITTLAPPTPTGLYATALSSFFSSVEECTTQRQPISPECETLLRPHDVCAIITALPSSVSPAYAEYTSSVSAWYTPNECALANSAFECRNLWRGLSEELMFDFAFALGVADCLGLDKGATTCSAIRSFTSATGNPTTTGTGGVTVSTTTSGTLTSSTGSSSPGSSPTPSQSGPAGNGATRWSSGVSLKMGLVGLGIAVRVMAW